MDQTALRSVPMARPNIGARERELVGEVLSGDVLGLGPFAERFEAAIAALSDRRHGIACSSGTAGLHMVVRALGIGEGDEVITTPFSFVASSNAILFERARPVFVDIEEETLGIDPERAQAAVGSRTRAILAVDVFGMPCRLHELETVASARDLHLIEDSCEALGGRLGERPLGSFGVASVFAFYPNKQITTGEGGLVVTDDDALARTIRSLRNQGRDEDGTWLRHVQLGFNYRLDEMSAALGVAQIERLEELRAGRDRVAAAYDAALSGLPWLSVPRAPAEASVDWFVYVVRLAEDLDRDRMIELLATRGVPARPYFSPIHLQPFYRETFGHGPGDFPITERVAATTLALPFSSRHTDDEVARVVEALTAAAAELGAS